MLRTLALCLLLAACFTDRDPVAVDVDPCTPTAVVRTGGTGPDTMIVCITVRTQ
jgi:hypothetical protein